MKYLFTLFTLISLILLISTSIAQTVWTKYDDLSTISPPFAQSDPVLKKGLPGSMDAAFVCMPSVIFDETNSTYHMWYNYSNSQTFEYIGHATSNDGIIWNKDSLNNPILTKGPAGNWDAYGVSTPCVIHIDSLYHMWYKGYSTSSYSGHGAIGHATTPHPDSTWTKDSLNPVLDVGAYGEWDDVWIGCPSVLMYNNTYHMWYNAWNGIIPHVRIGHATTPHLDSTWTKDSLNPVLSFGAVGSWDYPRVDAPSVVFDGTTFHMWYSGGDTWTWRIGYARSPVPDGRNWIKADSLNPVLVVGTAGEWDDYGVAFRTVLLDTISDTFKMWYSGIDGPWNMQIGYATAPDCTFTGLFEFENISVPGEYVLEQNFPNPFNPSTTIEFNLPKSSVVTLIVFNIIGEKVVTLVSDRLSAGSYSYEWDASNLASGVYLYRLEAEGFLKIRKMILMK